MRTSHAKKTTLPVEIYSTNTLRPIDLLDALACNLDPLKLSKQERNEVRAALSLVRKYDTYRDEAYDEKYHDAYEALVEVAENHLAPYTYYGSSEGDGACIGVWADVDGVLYDVLTEELETLDKDGCPPAGYVGLVSDVNDHGNISLYNVDKNGKMTEVWSVV